MREKPVTIQCRRCHQAGFTLVEMLATVALLALLGWIVYFVFLSAQVVASESRALGNVYQTARGIFKVMEADLEGAWLRRDSSTDFAVSPPSVGLIFYSNPYTDGSGNERFTTKIDKLELADVKPTTTVWDVPNQQPLILHNHGLVFLTTVSPEGGQDRAQARVMYILKAGGDLVRGVQYDDVFIPTDPGFLDYDLATATGEKDYVIAHQVTALQLRFLDKYQDKWDNNWQTGGAFKRYLPRAVEVRIRIRDPRGRIRSADDIEGEPRLGIWFTQVFAIPAALAWP